MEREAICPKCTARYPVVGDSAGRQFRCGKCRTVFTFQDTGPSLPLPRPRPEPSASRARSAGSPPVLAARRKLPFRIGTAVAGAVVITLAAMEYRSNSEARRRAEASESRAISGEERARGALAELEAEQARRIAKQRRVAPALVRVGRLAVDFGRWDEALDSLNAALTHDPSLAEARLLRAVTLVALHDYATGASEFAAAAHARPEDEGARALAELCRRILAGKIAPNAASRFFARIFARRREFALAAWHVRVVEERAEAYRELLSGSLPRWRDEALTVGAEGDLRLDLTGCGIRDLTPLKDLILDELVLDGNPVSDLWPLREMSLRSLSLWGADTLEDLSPLEGMPLERLNLSRTSVADLSALAGMPLECLIVDFTAVSDLSPIRGAPLRFVSVVRTPVRDLTALEGMRLEGLRFEPREVISGIALVRSMPTLMTVGTFETGGIPAEEFWRKFDGRALR